MKKILLSITLISTFISSNSQVFTAGLPFSGYEDLNPDVLLKYTVTPYTHQTYGINLWDDGNNDLEFVAHGSISSGGTGAYINVTSFNSNVYVRQERFDSVYMPGSSSWNVTNVARSLGTGEQINTLDAIWDNTTLFLTDHSGAGGGIKDVNDWIGGEKFLGLKYMAGNSIAYGWVRLECPNEDSCYVKDFSFSPPLVGINETQKNNLMIHPNPVVNDFYLNNFNVGSFDVSKLKIRDLYGKEVRFGYEINNGNLKIDISGDLPDGFYILEYVSNDQIFSKKLVKISK